MYRGGNTASEQRMKMALGIAFALHAVLLLGVSFDAATDDRQPPPQIDVTLARQPSPQAPENATHIAQANQQGSGDLSEQADVSSRASAPPLVPAAAEQIPALQQRAQTGQPSERVVSTTAPANYHLRENTAADLPAEGALRGISPEVDQLTRELAELEATLEQQATDYSNMPRVKRLTALSTREAVDAAYLHDWRRRVEAVGNQYYPEASIRYGIYGSLRLLVVIDHSGRLDNIRVLSSSGYALLDEAAVKIVRMASPYAPFPPELRATADKLEIIRTWQFQENRLSSG
ncbi:energy transducer TonB [Parahaliea aestuarii]|uniref:Energy transducer TonB n=1 Tax=Parahaliea aestuarii TaxID=1852021 RepID=A0A5C8ZYC1_9GAMM|nr:energy transducer TonB [Parahaliea aestuarii]TXS92251.1 energy transducer TonB [Parahaliea aestuarii]